MAGQAGGPGGAGVVGGAGGVGVADGAGGTGGVGGGLGAGRCLDPPPGTKGGGTGRPDDPNFQHGSLTSHV